MTSASHTIATTRVSHASLARCSGGAQGAISAHFTVGKTENFTKTVAFNIRSHTPEIRKNHAKVLVGQDAS